MTQSNTYKKQYIIREYQDRDMPGLLKLYESVWQDEEHVSAQARFDWQYFQNPNNAESGKPLFFVMEQEGEIIGMVCGIGIKLKIKNEICHADWVGDFMIHPNHRGRKGIVLANYIRDHSQILIGFPAEYVTRLWRRAGGVDTCHYLTRRCIMDFDYLLDEKGYNEKLIDKINVLWKPFNKLIKRINSSPTINCSIDEINFFDKRFDDLWNRVYSYYPVIGVRDSRYLNWRFIKCPHQTYRVFSARRDDKILGYVVIREYEIEKDVKVGSIVDFLADPKDKDVIYALFQNAVNSLKSKGVQYIDCVAITPHKIFVRTLRKLGFIFKVRGTSGVCYSRVGDHLYKPMGKASNWFITMADSDEEIS